MRKEGLETYIKLLEENIQNAEAMKGKDVDYWLAHIGGVGHERMNALMETISISTFASKAGDKVKDGYDAITSAIKMTISDSDKETLHEGIDAIKVDSSMSTADRVAITVAQSVVDLKKGDTDKAAERLFDLNPFYKAVESYKKSKANQASNHASLAEKNKIIDDQIAKWKAQLKDAQEELKVINVGEVNNGSSDTNSNNSVVSKTTDSSENTASNIQIDLSGTGDFQSVLSEIAANIDRLNANIA